MKIVCWNVNSVGARLDRVSAFLKRSAPDVLMLQEIKCMEEKFPAEVIRELGYVHQAVFGQKTYNGVAILSRHPLTNIVKGFGDGHEDPQSRFIKAEIGDLTLVDVYVPNGQERGSEKFAYKMRWLERLKSWLDGNIRKDQKFLIAGDFNIAPEERDVYDPSKYTDHIHFTPEERAALAKVVEFGLIDSFRLHHPDGGLYSWWDYRELSFPKNKGLRIDMMYLTPALSSLCVATGIDRDERKGEKPSDHAPIWAELKL